MIEGNSPLEGIRIEFSTNTVVRDNTMNGSPIVDLGNNTVLANNH
jgi:hypothetical protein